jgi:protein TonB
MNTRSLLAASWEIKRSYQKNLAIGFGISGMIHLTVITALMILFSGPPEVIKVIEIPHGPLAPIPPPTIRHDPLPPPVNPEIPAKPDFGIITPVPDDEAPVDDKIYSQDDLAGMAPPMPIDIFDNAKIIIDTQKVAEELLPPPGTPSFYDEPPVAVNCVAPDYPDLAHRTGLEGKVWLEVLIDKNGNVRDVLVIKSTNPNAGFEEAALEAAWKSTWKPAISNGLPIAVRVTYSVVFKLQ